MSNRPVLLSIDGSVATVTLNRPDAGNTITLPLAQALLQASIRCDQDASIRCVVITGTGKLFCGGGDIAAFAEAGVHVSGYLSELAGTMHLAISRLMRMPKPLLTLVNGPAAGAGLSLAIAGDIVIAARSAHFSTAYSRVGLSPDGGMTFLLPRLVGIRKAQEMLALNTRVSAEEAKAIGLVSDFVEDKELAATGAQMAERLEAAPVGAIGAARNLLLSSFANPLEGQMELESRSIAASGATAESREGVSAFLERRAPDFKRSHKDVLR